MSSDALGIRFGSHDDEQHHAIKVRLLLRWPSNCKMAHMQTWTTTRHTSIQVMDSVLLTWYIIAHEAWYISLL